MRPVSFPTSALVSLLALAACDRAATRLDPIEIPTPSLPPPEALSEPPAAPPRGPDPREPKRGLWVWTLGRNGPEAERAAELAASWGVGRVFLKASNGDDEARWAKNFNPGTIAPFLKRGIEVWAFGYVYGEGVPDASGRTWGTMKAQGDALARVALQEGVSGIVVDAEIELVGRPDDAARLCAMLRARIADHERRAGLAPGSVLLAYTTFGWLDAHPGFPYEAFDAGCGDAFLPQVYYAFGWPGGVEGSLERMRDQIRRRGLRAPVWPIQSNERDPDVDRLQRFFELAGPDASVFYLHLEGSPQNEKLGLLEWRKERASSLRRP